jgi:hypothetical protein
MHFPSAWAHGVNWVDFFQKIASLVLRFHPQAPLVTVSFGSNQLYGEK